MEILFDLAQIAVASCVGSFFVLYCLLGPADDYVLEDYMLEDYVKPPLVAKIKNIRRKVRGRWVIKK